MTKDEFKKLDHVERSDWMLGEFPPNNHSLSGRKLIHGKAVNDATYMVKLVRDGIKFVCPIFEKWVQIVERTTQQYQDDDPRYAGVTLDPRWESFMAFREWHNLRYKEKYEVDKDLISDTRMYGPDTCVMVPHWLNVFFTGRDMKECTENIGAQLTGTGRYRAECGGVWCGVFDTQEQSHNAWKKEKLRQATLRKPEMDAIDTRIYPGILRILDTL